MGRKRGAVEWMNESPGGDGNGVGTTRSGNRAARWHSLWNSANEAAESVQEVTDINL